MSKFGITFKIFWTHNLWVSKLVHLLYALIYYHHMFMLIKNKWRSHAYAYAVTYMCTKNSMQ